MDTDRKNMVIKAASICGICASFLDLPIINILGLLRPRYSNFRNFASALGSTGSPHAGVISVWWIVYGVLLSVFSYGLLLSMKRRKALWQVGPLLILLFAVSDGIGSGVFPCDPHCLQITRTGKMHELVSAIGTIALLPSPFFTWTAWKSDRKWRAFRPFTLAIQAAGLLSFIALAYSTKVTGAGPFSGYAGLLQRIFLFVYYAWIFSVAVRLLTLRMSVEERRNCAKPGKGGNPPS